MWSGSLTTSYGEHYVVENARLYTLPERLPEILVSGFGPKAISLAAEVGDGFMTAMPNAADVRSYRDQGVTGLTQGGLKVCWAPDKAQARSTVHRLWRNMFLPGQPAQDLSLPRHFDEASSLVSEQMVTGLPLGPDPEGHVAAVREYIDAGFDEVYVAQIGPDQAGMIDFYECEVLPYLR